MDTLSVELTVEEAKAVAIALGATGPRTLRKAYPEAEMTDEHSIALAAQVLTAYMSVYDTIVEYEGEE